MDCWIHFQFYSPKSASFFLQKPKKKKKKKILFFFKHLCACDCPESIELGQNLFIIQFIMFSEFFLLSFFHDTRNGEGGVHEIELIKVQLICFVINVGLFTELDGGDQEADDVCKRSRL